MGLRGASGPSPLAIHRYRVGSKRGDNSGSAEVKVLSWHEKSAGGTYTVHFLKIHGMLEKGPTAFAFG